MEPESEQFDQGIRWATDSLLEASIRMLDGTL